MDIRAFLPILIIGGGFTFAGAIIYGAWLLGRYHGRDDEMSPDIANVEHRLARVEAVLNQTTGALDRLEAAHRYTVRMMTEAPTAASKLPARPITPH
jgi:predicted phage-related endonuclease